MPLPQSHPPNHPPRNQLKVVREIGLKRKKKTEDGDKGKIVELLIEDALCILRERGTVISFIHSGKNNQYDACGIDFLIEVFADNAVPVWITLQAKSGLNGLEDHYTQHQFIRHSIVIGPITDNEIADWRCGERIQHILEVLGPHRPDITIVQTPIPQTNEMPPRNVKKTNLPKEKSPSYLRALHPTVLGLSCMLERAALQASEGIVQSADPIRRIKSA